MNKNRKKFVILPSFIALLLVVFIMASSLSVLATGEDSSSLSQTESSSDMVGSTSGLIGSSSNLAESSSGLAEESSSLAGSALMGSGTTNPAQMEPSSSVSASLEVANSSVSESASTKESALEGQLEPALAAAMVEPAAVNEFEVGVTTFAQQFPDPDFALAVALKCGKTVDEPITELDIANASFLRLTGNFKDVTGIGILTSLSYLDISGNPVVSLPEEIGNLKSLRTLKATETKLQTLPESIGDLPNLNLLDVSRAELTSLPESIGNLTNLNNIAFAENNLSTLPASFANLNYVRSIVLSRNKFTSIPIGLHNGNFNFNNLIDISPDWFNGNRYGGASECLVQNYTQTIPSKGNIGETYQFNALPIYTQVFDFNPVIPLTYTLKSPTGTTTHLSASQFSIENGIVTLNDTSLLADKGKYTFTASNVNQQWTFNQIFELAEPVYTLNFDTQGGTPVPESQLIGANGLAQMPINPVKEYYDFAEWNTQADGTGISWNFTSMPVTKNITLYAQYQPKEYMITFNSMGGTTVADQFCLYDSLISKPADPSRTGYTFGGWYKEEQYGTTWNYAEDKVAGNVTLFAKWIPAGSSSVAPSSSSVTPASSGGSVPPASSGSVAPASRAPIQPATSSGVVPAMPGQTVASTRVTASASTVQSATPTRITSEQSSSDLVTTNLAGSNIPLGNLGLTSGWSLLNLILALVSAGAAIYNLFQWIFKRRTILYSSNGTPIKNKPYDNTILIIRTVSVISGIMVGIAFLILENMRQPMVFINANTPIILLLGIISALTIVGTILAVRKRNAAERAMLREVDENLEDWLNDRL